MQVLRLLANGFTHYTLWINTVDMAVIVYNMVAMYSAVGSLGSDDFAGPQTLPVVLRMQASPP